MLFIYAYIEANATCRQRAMVAAPAFRSTGRGCLIKAHRQDRRFPSTDRLGSVYGIDGSSPMRHPGKAATEYTVYVTR